MRAPPFEQERYPSSNQTPSNHVRLDVVRPDERNKGETRSIAEVRGGVDRCGLTRALSLRGLCWRESPLVNTAFRVIGDAPRLRGAVRIWEANPNGQPESQEGRVQCRCAQLRIHDAAESKLRA